MQVQTTSTAAMGFPSLPASPTLTNPDMILPYGEYDSAPSPPQDQYQSSDLPGPWNDTRTTEMQFSIGPPRMAGPMTPTTPIIYGNGTMLSDIGEVTEAESTPRRLPAPSERRALKGIGGPLRVSPSIGHSALLKRTKIGTHERKTSVESTSTVTSEGQVAEHVFADFDDGLSVDDSVFQGDDEQSVADSYTEEVIAAETERLAKREDSHEQEDDKNSSAALSRRAEAILLNAKKRLNNMEGNLTRARGSLYITPSGSMSSIHSSSPLSRSTPSPQNALRIVHAFGVTPTRHREFHTSSSSQGSPGHSRVYSENSIPSVQSQKAPFILRSASAGAGYMGTNGFRRHTSRESLSLEEPKAAARPVSAFPLNKVSPLSKSSPPLSSTLEPLDEEGGPIFGADRESLRSSMSDYSHFSQAESHRGLTRSASSMQMRDLRDQMHDLKGRLSSLRDQAREDSMKRRSLQSLRTPSPFTAAEQWYTDHTGYKEGVLSADKLVTQNPWRNEPNGLTTLDNSEVAKAQSPDHGESDVTSVYEDVREGHHAITEVHEVHRTIPEEVEEDGNNLASAVQEINSRGELDSRSGSDYTDEMISHEELDDYESEAESVYHDTIMPISHEDREDAFDYEHFFLHSAMGTMSQQRNNRRDSISSYGSEGSVETARGLPTEHDTSATDPRTSIGHLRNGSNASVSTLATFATASEGRGNDDYHEQDTYAVQQTNGQLSYETKTPVAIKRSTFGPPVDNSVLETQLPSPEQRSRPSSIIHDDGRQAAGGHRPSVSSLESISSLGTARSFPLVNKPKSSPDLKAESILSRTVTLNENEIPERQGSSPVHMLAKEDQILVERLVASLGKCVLGLQEAGSNSYEGRIWRRRLDAARRVLEGQEGAI
ncbi:hypothetical protein PVAG01_01560 [Phlyctema vagabunda]|uniref:Uncharacterized protein n=1 Tax=Phlyctema vagabunda TaxID=108571 RepID=A0ABR4PXT2_9HELO